MNTANPTSHEQTDLFDRASDDRARRTRRSMLWAAYGDALGFISELVDGRGLKRRTKGQPLDRLMSWKRRVGGRGGVDVELLAGCWSDDTQLRMAVSRAINGNGFDVESFARIELPLWPSYALGGGRTSKTAASNLGKPGALWYANTFPGWSNGGGNGAAMRIQPHVWSSPDLDSFMLDVIIDSVCTHGHPRAIVGACFHASTLADCLRTGAVPNLHRCTDIAAEIGNALSLIEHHRSLGPTWVALWEKETGQRLRDEWNATITELRLAINQTEVDADTIDDTAGTYRWIVSRLGLTDEKQRGSGILTPVAAVALAAIAPNSYEGIMTAANTVGTDTDTIATMAGALLGACSGASEPPEEPLDTDYLLSEANRLVAISRGQDVESHTYPDILTWAAPQAQADALVSGDAELAVEGLGPVTALAAEASWTPGKDFAWQWVRTGFGQTLLIKRRAELKPPKAGNTLTPPGPPSRVRSRRTTTPREQHSNGPSSAPLDRGVNVDAAVDFAKQHLHDDNALGYTVRRVARDGTLGDLAALVAALRDDLRR